MPEFRFNERFVNSDGAQARMARLFVGDDSVARVRRVEFSHTGNAEVRGYLSHNRMHMRVQGNEPANDAEQQQTGGGPDIWWIGHAGSVMVQAFSEMDMLIGGDQVLVLITETTADVVVMGRIVYEVEKVGLLSAAVIRHQTVYSELYTAKPELQAFPWVGSGL